MRWNVSPILDRIKPLNRAFERVGYAISCVCHFSCGHVEGSLEAPKLIKIRRVKSGAQFLGD